MEKLGLLCKKWPKVSFESYLNEEKASYLTRYGPKIMSLVFALQGLSYQGYNP